MNYYVFPYVLAGYLLFRKIVVVEKGAPSWHVFLCAAAFVALWPVPAVVYLAFNKYPIVSK